MIHSLEIPKDRWLTFLELVNRASVGRRVRIEVGSLEKGDQELGPVLTFFDLDIESEGPVRDSLLITLGSDREELTHLVPTPGCICIGYNEAAELEWLAIEGSDASKTIIYFKHPQLMGEGMPATPAPP